MKHALAVMLALVVASGADAQEPRKSQRAELMQMLGVTEIRVMWIGPVARGRTLFGTLVPYGKVWTPSADSAMRFTVSRDVMVNGSALPAGTYSVWAIPDSAQWTLIFNKRGHVFHMRTYVEADDALRVTAKVDSLPHMETLNASFPSVDGRKATFRIQWGPVAVALEIEAPQ